MERPEAELVCHLDMPPRRAATGARATRRLACQSAGSNLRSELVAWGLLRGTCCVTSYRIIASVVGRVTIRFYSHHDMDGHQKGRNWVPLVPVREQLQGEDGL